MRAARIALAVVLAAAGQAQAQITVTAGPATGATGTEATVAVQVRGAVDLGSFQAELSFDPAVLQLKSVEKGALMANALFEYSAGAEGTVKFGAAAAESVAGDGVLAECRFLVMGRPGSRSELKFVKVEAWTIGSPRPTPLAVEAVDGAFTVAGAPKPEPEPAPKPAPEARASAPPAPPPRHRFSE
jgi:hypothetical protein